MVEVKGLNISIQQLLEKMEKELGEAKDSSSLQRMRERVHTIKSLCELILEVENEDRQHERTNTYPLQSKQQIEPSFIQQPQRLKMDDESNGDSIFDF